MSGKLAQLEAEAAARIAACPAMAGLEDLRVEYLGRKGAITELLKSVAQLPAAERPAFGAEANQLRVSGFIAQRSSQFHSSLRRTPPTSAPTPVASPVGPACAAG